MARGRRASKGKKINPTFFVFCEGETEEAYVNFLKRHFRLPSIQIHSKVSRNNIDEKKIRKYKQDKTQHEKDKDFLMYDLDAPGILERLKKIGDATLLVSNPCIELWFLLHDKNHKAECDTTFCNREMENRNKPYKKGKLGEKMEQKLREKMDKATERAKNLKPHKNPSTTVYKLIEELKALKG